MSEHPFIKSFEFTEPIIAGKENTGYLLAEWPNPAWSILGTDTKINEKEKKIYISVRGQRGSGMAAMVIKPFQLSISIFIPDQGEWDIVIHGRAGDFIHKIEAK